jgi:hypothetical protein
MSKHSPFSLFFAVTDLVIGAAAILFFACAALALPYFNALPIFSTSFLISLALPAFILLLGVFNLLRSPYSPVLTYFVSFVTGIYSLTALFTVEPPYFLKPSAPPAAADLFRFVIPIAAIAYFALHSLSSFLIARLRKDEEAVRTKGTFPVQAELFCARCQAKINSGDEVCASCGELLSGWHCADCGFEGRKKEFNEGRCPRCGHTQPPDTDENDESITNASTSEKDN